MMFIVLLLSAYDLRSINGFVTDAANGEPLAYANVYLENTQYGSATNEKGYYVLQDIPAATYTLVFSYIGYKTVSLEINLETRSITKNVEMDPAVIQIEEIQISAERTRFEQDVEISHITFTPREIQSVPGLVEKDLIKILQLMPGIVTMHDLSNKLYVRGGSPDENLVLLDGITVYNPSTHLFGLFSTFNPDAVDDAELYAGGFPAQYGDRLSSVLNITTKEGNSKKLSGQASVGLVTSKILLEGPIPNGSFLLNCRRTYLDALVWAYSKIKKDTLSLPYYFYDGIAKINFNPSPENRFTLTGFGGSDVMSFEESFTDESEDKIGLEWGNRGASLRWRRVFNPKFYGEILGAWSNFLTHFKYEDFTDSTNNMHIYEDIIDYTIKCDCNYFVNDIHTIDIGVDGKFLKIGYNLDVQKLRLLDKEHETQLITGYVQDKWSLVPSILFVQTGLRISYYSIGNRWNYDPRFGIKYHFQPNSALNLALSKHQQFIVTINSQESYFSIFDFWRPVDSIHDIPTSYHAIAGIEHWFGGNTIMTFEPYFKYYHDLLLPEEDDIAFSTPSESLRIGSGYSMGVDFFLKKSYRDIFGWVSYSLAYTRREQGGNYYSPRYDRRHNTNFVLGFTIPHMIPLLKNGKMSMRWYFATGLPYAEDLGRYRYRYYDSVKQRWENKWVTIRGPRDAHRLPISHRLDLHLEKNFHLLGMKGSWYIDIVNVYDQENILFHTWDYDEDPPRKESYAVLPIPIPSLGINIRF
jgi:hypothetical protein